MPFFDRIDRMNEPAERGDQIKKRQKLQSRDRALGTAESEMASVLRHFVGTMMSAKVGEESGSSIAESTGICTGSVGGTESSISP